MEIKEIGHEDIEDVLRMFRSSKIVTPGVTT